MGAWNRRKCELCPEITAARDERFCKKCRKLILAKLENGYLQDTKVKTSVREQLGRKARNSRVIAESFPDRDDV